MSVYYQDDLITLHHGDCLEVMADLPQVDLAVTSPPYNKGAQSGAYANMRDGYSTYTDSMKAAEYVEWQQAVLSEMWRLTAANGAIFYNHKPQIRDGVADLPTALIPPHALLRQIIIWNRKGGMNWNASFFVPRHEWVLLLAHPGFRLKDRGSSNAGDVWEFGPEREDFGHPCPFPEALPRTAIEATNAQTILDPYAGAGTTLMAAKALGRKSIGIEMDESYCEIIAKRCAQDVFDFGTL